jgi:hypothetical protein
MNNDDKHPVITINDSDKEALKEFLDPPAIELDGKTYYMVAIPIRSRLAAYLEQMHSETGLSQEQLIVSFAATYIDTLSKKEVTSSSIEGMNKD